MIKGWNCYYLRWPLCLAFVFNSLLWNSAIADDIDIAKILDRELGGRNFDSVVGFNKTHQPQHPHGIEHAIAQQILLQVDFTSISQDFFSHMLCQSAGDLWAGLHRLVHATASSLSTRRSILPVDVRGNEGRMVRREGSA